MSTIEISTELEGSLIWRLPDEISAMLDQLPADEQARVLKTLENIIGSRANILLACILLEGERRDKGFDMAVDSGLELSFKIFDLSKT